MILNLTQHEATKDQQREGVVEPGPFAKGRIKSLLTFEEIPSVSTIRLNAKELAILVVEQGFDSAMIGGAPFLMEALSNQLKLHGIKPLFAFSQRESVDVIQVDGSVTKTSVFVHKGFVEW